MFPRNQVRIQLYPDGFLTHVPLSLGAVAAKSDRMRSRPPAQTRGSGKAGITQEDGRRTFQRAVKLLAAKPWSVADLRERLLKSRGINRSAVDAVIARLQEYGYLDDERYAFGYASLRVKQRPIGRQRLKRDLLVKRVDQQVAEEALDLVFGETSEEELIDRAIEKRIRLRGRPQTRDAVRKLFDHLMRQGFPYELVSDKVQTVVKIDSDEPADS
jgi:SOS response regulatory protein OraA/RecX